MAVQRNWVPHLLLSEQLDKIEAPTVSYLCDCGNRGVRSI